MTIRIRILTGVAAALTVLAAAASLDTATPRPPSITANQGIGWDQCGLPGTGPCPPPAG